MDRKPWELADEAPGWRQVEAGAERQEYPPEEAATQPSETAAEQPQQRISRGWARSRTARKTANSGRPLADPEQRQQPMQDQR
jgi:hypothetical protein